MSKHRAISEYQDGLPDVYRSTLQGERSKKAGRKGRGVVAACLAAMAIGIAVRDASATPVLNPSEGHINFYKHTSPPDDLYTANPTAKTIQFMNAKWPRLLTFSGYWDQNNKLSWFPNAWTYDDSYAIYSSDSYWDQIVQQHPDWVLKDGQGRRLYINWGCYGGTCPQYAANITDPNGFRSWWISQARFFLERSLPYKGLFIDDVNLDLSRISDGYGNPTVPIDPLTGQPMTQGAWRKYFADFMVQVRAAFPATELVHNSLWFLDWNDSEIQRQIQAADWINLERGVNDAGLTGGTGYWSLYRLLSFVDFVHAQGRGVILDGEAPLSDSDAAREYSAAAYLLVSSGKDMVGDSAQTPSHWWNGFDEDLGTALGPRYSWQNLWRRDFAGGMALLNPPGAAGVTVSLPAALIRVDGSVVNSVSLNAAEGAVLRAPAALSGLACAPSEIPAGGTTTCTVRLMAPASAVGVAVILSSTNSLLQVPTSVMVPAGSTVAAFTATAGAVRYSQPASVIASLNQTSQAAALNLIGTQGTPPPPSCQISGGTSGPTVNFTMQDANVGLAQILQIQSINATVSIPSFARGTVSPVAVTTTQIDLTASSRADFQIVNTAGVSAACGVTFGRSVWSSAGGTSLGTPTVARNADGRLQLFFHGADHALWTIAQAAPNGGWLSAQSLGGVIIGDPAVGVNADGRLEAFALGADYSLWHIWQTAPAGAWSSWNGLGGRLTGNPAVGRNQDGRLEVFGLGTDQTLWHIWQTAPGGGWSQWDGLGGANLGNPAVMTDRDGRLEVFAIASNQKLWSIHQTVANGGWSGWTNLNGKLAGVPAPGVNQDGRLEVFARGADNALWHMWQTSPGGSWSSFQSLGGFITSEPAVTSNSDGRLEAFARGGNKALWSIAQKAPNSEWSAWGSVGGVLASGMSAAQNQDGRIEVFASGSDNVVWSIRQISPGSWN